MGVFYIQTISQQKLHLRLDRLNSSHPLSDTLIEIRPFVHSKDRRKTLCVCAV